MIVSEKMREEEWWKNNFAMLNESFLEAFGLRSLLTQTDMHESFWHYSRVFEYPWAVAAMGNEFVDKRPRILDLGANEQFSLALVEAGVTKDLVIHHTWTDSQHMGIITMRCGLVPLMYPRQKHKDRFTIFWGSPHQFPWVEEFDVIFNLSIMEHIEEENLRDWFTYSWRALKPGGKLVFTIDYMPEEPLGTNNKDIGIQNHDLSFMLETDAVMEQAVLEELPWSKEYDPERFTEEAGAKLVNFTHRKTKPIKLGVYGFVLRKPQ